MSINEISDISYLLPPMSTETDSSESTAWDSGLYLDYMILSMEIQRCLKNGDYLDAAEKTTQLIELTKEHPLFAYDDSYKVDNFITLRAQRAHCYILAKNYDAALPDLNWITTHGELSRENEVHVLEGLIDILQGREPNGLKGPADRGGRLSLLLLNEPENLESPKTDWLLLPPKERIQKLIEGRHYAAAIEEIDRMDLNSYRWGWNSDNEFLALRGVCYALRGNYVQAINDYKNCGFFFEQKHELAVIYSMAGEQERALHALKYVDSADIQATLIRQLIEKKA